MTRPKMD